MLEEITRQIEGHTICALGDAAAWPVQVILVRMCVLLLCRMCVWWLAVPSGLVQSVDRRFEYTSYNTDSTPTRTLTKQGLIRRFKHVVDERIEKPEAYDPSKYFQVGSVLRQENRIKIEYIYVYVKF